MAPSSMCIIFLGLIFGMVIMRMCQVYVKHHIAGHHVAREAMLPRLDFEADLIEASFVWIHIEAALCSSFVVNFDT